MKKNKMQLISEGYKNHFGRPKTRRQLLGQGMIAGFGSVMLPSLLSMISEKAYAEGDCGVTKEVFKTTIPVINIELAGGAGIAGKNVMVGGRGGQLDPLPEGYAHLGHPGLAMVPSESINGDQDGLLFASNSPMLEGIRAKLEEKNRRFINGVVICGTSSDDTGNNLHDTSHVFSALGRYQAVANVGTTRADPIERNADFDALRMIRIEDAKALKALSVLKSNLDRDGAKKILMAAGNMGKEQLKKFQFGGLSTQTKALIECAYGKVDHKLDVYSDMLLDPTFNEAFKNNVNFAISNEQETATIANLVLRGIAATGTISLGGYDYHGRGIENQNKKDKEAGEVLGIIMQAACHMNQSLQINLFSDGSVGYNPEGAPASDRGSNACVVSFLVTPGRKTNVIRTQIGAFTSFGVDRSTGPWADSPAQQARTMFYNGLLAMGKGDRLAEFTNDPVFNTFLEDAMSFPKVV